MKRTWLALIVTSLLTALVTKDVHAKMTRGIYVNGQIHYIGLGVKGKNNVLFHQTFSAGDRSYTLTPTGATQASPACNPDPSLRSPMNAAVFDDKIYFVYTGYPQAAGKAGSCNYTSGTNLYLTYWDLVNNTWAQDKDSQGNPIFPKLLGAVHHNNTVDKKGNPLDLAGAAIAVFNPDPNNPTNPTTGELYVFADNGTYTSADGLNWAFSAGPGSSIDAQPMDAITYYPPDADPQMMLILGTVSGGTFTSLSGATWNGLFGSRSTFASQAISLYPFVNVKMGLALLAGTAAGGNKGPTLQLFVGGDMGKDLPVNQIFRSEYAYTTSGGNWHSIQDVATTAAFDSMLAFPTYRTLCSDSNNTLTQSFQIDFFHYSNGTVLNFGGTPISSDNLVPQNSDIPLNCGSWGGTVTNTGAGTSDDQATLRKYWTLAGVVMGAPPFAVNDVQDYDIPDLSNIDIGQSQTGEVTNSQTSDNSLLVSAGASLRGGIKDIFGVEGEIDCSYKHAWESENQSTQSSTVGYGFTLGTASANTEDQSRLGMYGWAIFHTPNIVVQNYAVYAYDYNLNYKTGTYIGQDIHTVQIDQQNLSYTTAAFELANPGGNNDTYPGLMSGITPLARSTDLANPAWYQQWEANANDSESTHYVTKVGSGGKGEPQLNMLSFTNSGSKANFSQEIQKIVTKGQTSSVDVSLGGDLNVGTEVKGFKVGLKAGYAGEFSNSVETTTTLGSEVEAELNMKACYTSDCTKILQIQPYLLSATDGNAPWIPSAYSGSRPWAIAWTINSYKTIGGQTSGASPVASNLSGTVVGREVSVSSLSSSPASRYRVNGGRLEWTKRGRKTEKIPMTAGSFNPALGVMVRVNHYSWSSSQTPGKWSRKGKVWTFRPNESVQRDRATVKLDFGNRTWDFGLSRADLSSAMGATEGHTHVALNVNNKYEFHFNVAHTVSTSWSRKTVAQGSDALSLTHYSGSYPFRGHGVVDLAGRLPSNLDHFGDISFVVNGRQHHLPVLSQRGYRRAIADGKTITIRKGESQLSLDFGRKRWSFHTEGKTARSLAPLAAKAGIEFKVGGRRWYSGEQLIANYTSKLKYRGPKR